MTVLAESSTVVLEGKEPRQRLPFYHSKPINDNHQTIKPQPMITKQFFKTVFLLAFLGIAITPSVAQNHVLRDHDTSLQITTSEELYKVVRIVDGDTFYAKSAQGINLKYRLIGINTPEFSHFGRPEQPFAQEATDYLIDLIKDEHLILKYDVQKQDKYGRELVYAYLPDGTFINSKLMAAGWAQIMTIPPNVAHTSCFLAQQHQAQSQNLGIWAH